MRKDCQIGLLTGGLWVRALPQEPVIIKTKHPEIEDHELELKRTLSDPDEIRLSRSDGSVFLYYRCHGRLWLAVVVKHRNGDGFVITAYFTDRIKEGESVYKRGK